jgi:uncharacterized protein (UPF0333 family)
MVLISLLPILIVILLAAGIGTYAFKSNKKRHRNHKKMKWVVGGYFIIILVATVVPFNFFLAENTESRVFSKDEMSQQEAAENKIIDSAINGKLPKLEGVYTEKESWSFSFNGKDIKISNKDQQDYYATVFVISKPEDDGIIEAAHYMGKMIVDGVDFTEEKGSPDIEVEESALRIKAPEHVEVKFTKFSEGFVFDQFTGRQSMFSRSYFSVQGNEFILLKVPKSLRVSGDFNYVNAE